MIKDLPPIEENDDNRLLRQKLMSWGASLQTLVNKANKEERAQRDAFTVQGQKAAPKDSVAYSQRQPAEPTKWAKVTEDMYTDRHGFTRMKDKLTEEMRLEILEDLGFDPLEAKKQPK